MKAAQASAAGDNDPITLQNCGESNCNVDVQ